MKNEVLEIKPNTPTEISLAYPDGKPLDKDPPTILYKLTDGRVMFVPPEAREKIQAARVRPGEPFTILKAETVNGKVSVEWKIGRTASQVAQAAPEPAKTPRTSRIEQALCTVVEAMAAAHRHAKQIGFEAMPQFTGQDARAMAITLLIGAREGAR